MTYQELHNMLPSSWAEMKLKDFIKLTDVQIIEEDEFDGMFVGLDNSINIISTLTGVPAGELEETLTYQQALRLDEKLNFILKLPEPLKEGKIKWKPLDSTKYSDFVRYNQLSSDLFRNMPAIVSKFSVNGMTIEEAEELPMTEAYTGFFLLRRMSERSLNTTRNLLARRLLKQTLKERLKNFLRTIGRSSK